MATWAIDLDGVIWRGDELILGADRAVQRLLDEGHQVVFCTNHAMAPRYKRRRLDQLGVPDAPVVTAAQSAAAACAPGSRVLVLGDPSLAEVLEASDLEVVLASQLGDGPVPDLDVVVVGATPDWDRSHVGLAADGARNGAAFLATNDDPTFPTTSSYGSRLLPGNGALLAAVEATASRRATITGKPHAPMASLLEQRFGSIDVVVGDRPDTDGQLAERLGARFGLVLSGVTSVADLPVRPEPAHVGADLSELVEVALRGG